MNRYLANLGVARAFVLVLSMTFVLCFTNLVSANDELKNNTQRADLFSALAQAKTELEGRASEDAVWNYWFDQAPSEKARALLDSAIERREAYDFEAAENILDELIALAPDFAEGYNQRAFIRFLRQNYIESETDIKQTLRLEPKHFGALAGLYLIYSFDGEREAAIDALQQAVTIYPWLKERGNLPKSQWPESYKRIHTGQDI